MSGIFEKKQILILFFFFDLSSLFRPNVDGVTILSNYRLL